MKKCKILALLGCVLMLSGCISLPDESLVEFFEGYTVIEEGEQADIVEISVDTMLLSEDQFTDRDYEVNIEGETYSTITLSDTGSNSNATSVHIDNKVITIAEEGIYVISGSLTEGQIYINAGESDKIQLVLNGVSISNSETAPICILEANKVFITTASGTTNTLIATTIVDESAETNIDAAIFSKTDLTLNGEGSLIIEATDANGITSKDDLVITSGAYQITATKHGLEANNSIRIAGGSFDITSEKDGLHSEHDEDAEKGYIYIIGGEFYIDVQGDGFDSSSFIEIIDGYYDILVGGGYENATTQGSSSDEGFFQMIMPGGNSRTGGIQGNISSNTAGTEDTSVSNKAFKATTLITIQSGIFNINTCEDGIHSDYALTIAGGEFEIYAGDDGIRSEVETVVLGGDITIFECYEGIEGHTVLIAGGIINIRGEDDGINAATSSLAPSGLDISITITGGSLVIDTYGNGDGFDANGNIYVSGGEVLISSTTDTRDTTLDYENDAVITGGTFIATGSSSQTRQNFDSNSTQASMMVDFNSFQSGTLYLEDSQGNVLLDINPVKEYQTILISLPELQVGETYTVIGSSETIVVEMDSLLYGTSTSHGSTGGMTMPENNRR